MAYMKKLGFNVNPHYRHCQNIQEVIDYIEEYKEKRKGKRKKEEGSCKVLTKIGWNVIIQK